MIRLPGHPLATTGISPTDQVTGEVTGEVRRLLRAVVGEISRQQIQFSLGLNGEEHFRKAYLKPALEAKMIEMTRPDKPRSSNQRYRLTALGQSWLEKHPGTGVR